MVKFYDTSALLNLQEGAFEKDPVFYISNITLTELESIKTSGTRDEETKWAARNLLRLLNENVCYSIIITDSEDEAVIKKFNLLSNNDSKIIASAYNVGKREEITFITDDLSCKALAMVLNLRVESTNKIEKEEYTGFKEITMEEEELANFYEAILNTNENIYGLLENEYLLIQEKATAHIIDKYKWKGEKYIKIPFRKAESNMFGKITPKNHDAFQHIALDSLASNQITLLRGRAGTGKSYLAFGYMFELLEAGKIDKIIVFCNTVATKGSAKLGFYPGSRTEKLLDSQIGNLLESKLGDRCEVERLIDEGKLVLLPMSDIRGYDTTGLNAAVYISEAQNLDVELMRLALQRIGEDSICIIDGDYAHQVDMSMYAGVKNGMRRVSEVFKGKDFYGEVELQNIYRSKIAKTAELL